MSLNPSLSYDDKKPTECELKEGYRYCLRKNPRRRATAGFETAVAVVPTKWLTSDSELLCDTSCNLNPLMMGSLTSDK